MKLELEWKSEEQQIQSQLNDAETAEQSSDFAGSFVHINTPTKEIFCMVDR